MNKILHISLMALLIAGTVFLLGFTDHKYQDQVYTEFRIDILNESEMDLISQEDIRNFVEKDFGKIVGSPLWLIDLNKLENKVVSNPYVSTCEVFQAIGGILEMKLRVRKPLVRIINTDDQQYYLDYTGCAMPLNPSRPLPVLVANGNIPDHYISVDNSEIPLTVFPDSSILYNIYRIAFYIADDNFLKSFIDQVYVDENKEIELVPKIGSQQIEFGDAGNAREKLENLRTFYLKVMSKINWNNYKSINLKYKNQVICAKNKQYEQK